MPYQHGGMEHIVPLHLPIFIINGQRKAGIVPIPAICGISDVQYGWLPDTPSIFMVRFLPVWHHLYINFFNSSASCFVRVPSPIKAHMKRLIEFP